MSTADSPPSATSSSEELHVISDNILNRPEISDRLLASTVHPQLHKLLDDPSLTGLKLGTTLLRVVDVQLGLHAAQEALNRKLVRQADDDVRLHVLEPDTFHERADVGGVGGGGGGGAGGGTLFAQAAVKVAVELALTASDDEAAAMVRRVPLLTSPAFRTAMLQQARLPFPVISRALALAPTNQKHKQQGSGAEVHASVSAQDHRTSQSAKRKDTDKDGDGGDDIDEWILKNERYMRARLVLDDPKTREGEDDDDDTGPPNPSFAQLGIDNAASHWQRFMVGLGRDARHVFPPAQQTQGEETITIARPAKDELPGVRILDHHRKDVITLNTLPAFQRRFDAMTMGILKGLKWDHVLVAGGIVLAALTSTTDEEAAKAEGSDVDLYLYGLTTEQANAKLQEIEKVFVANLPPDEPAYGVLRTTQTITFVPQRYPRRRVQVVLKLLPNPMAVLLNFDLDQVAVGYTGDEVWMLPRAVRALWTGYTTFTMELIHGSFLAPRKATQDQRVFKYARRGYGLRFLPSYVARLPCVSGDQQTTVKPAVGAKETTTTATLPRDELQVTLREERARIAWWLAQRCDFRQPLQQRRVRMVEIDCRTAITPELAERSSLSCWQLFARHVALWELAQAGYCVLEETGEVNWVEDVYADDPLGYQDAPDFSWGSEFSLDNLRSTVNGLYHNDQVRLENNLLELKVIPEVWTMHGTSPDQISWGSKYRKERLYELIPLKRIILASSLQEALAEPLVALVHLPKNLRAHAEAALRPTMQTSFVDVFEPSEGDHHTLHGWDTPESQALTRSEVEYGLGYWIVGRHRFAGARVGASADADAEDDSLAAEAPPQQLYWQLTHRPTDELLELIHAFRRAHRDLAIPIAERNLSVRVQVSRRLVRPTERSEEVAFGRWVGMRASRFTGWYGSTEDWAMLAATRDQVFRRFQVEADEAARWDDLFWFDADDPEQQAGAGGDGARGDADADEPGTVQAFLANEGRWPRYSWRKWYRQRLPPVALLPELEHGVKDMGGSG